MVDVKAAAFARWCRLLVIRTVDAARVAFAALRDGERHLLEHQSAPPAEAPATGLRSRRRLKDRPPTEAGALETDLRRMKARDRQVAPIDR